MNPAISNKHSSSDLLHLILGITQEIFIVTDTLLNIVIFNEEARMAARKFTGKDLSTGVPILFYIIPEQKARLGKILGDVLLGARAEFKYRLPDVTYSIKLQPVYESNRVKFISITCIDITAEEQALLRVSKERQLLQRAEIISGMGSWEWDITTNKVVWSDELYRLFGMEPGEAEPSKELGFSFVHPEDIAPAEATLSNSFKTGAPYSKEIRFITRDGQLRYVFCQGIVIRNEIGRNEKFIGTFHDVTSKKLLEESIRKRVQRFQSLIEHSADLIMQINKDRLIIYVSPAMTSMMQYTPEEVIGSRAGIYIHPEDFPVLLPEFEKILDKAGIPRTFEYRVVRKDGSYLWVEGTMTNLFHISGVESLVLNQRDITQRKEAERLLNELNKTLESRAQELSSSNVELEKFAYIASHDLQEPLRMITSFLQLLKKKYEGELDDKAQQYIYHAIDGADRMKILINDLLEYSRAGSKHGVLKRFGMNEIVNTVSLIFKEQLDATGGTLSVGILPDIVAEKPQMLQLVQNLVGNAIKYRSEAAPLININGYEKETEWLFSVEDNGIGIPTKFSEEIFNIFQRLHGKNEYQGTGIGLAICKKIAEAHGGRIWVVPGPQQGSIFYFSIKKQQAAVEQTF